MKMKVSDYVARCLQQRAVGQVFGIIGSGNARIFDSIHVLGATEIVCVHHEQAAVMAAQTYYRTSGTVTAALLTTGAGSLNGVTGVVGAWADSIPLLVISSNEKSIFTRDDNPLRMWGVQGYDSTEMVRKVTKYASRLTDPKRIRFELEKAFHLASAGRPGPCWLDIPMDVQGAEIDPEALEPFVAPAPPPSESLAPLLPWSASEIWDALRRSKRPLLWLGHGIRLAGAHGLLPRLLDAAKVPALVTWAGIDMIESAHPLIFGRAGVYGGRAANFILQNCDFLLTIGTRLAMPQVGYEINELSREARIVAIDIDPTELAKYPNRIEGIRADAGVFLKTSLEVLSSEPIVAPQAWTSYCSDMRTAYPFCGPEHADKDGFMNSYTVMERINKFFKQRQIVVTDMGTALLSGHQVLKLREGQRLMTSTGLGEMGYGLPAAIGASFATNRGEVLCLHCDGGMMMNLQELQTISHHKLPIKIIVFNNDGYLMIKHTQKAMLGGRYAGTNEKTGVSCPDFSKIAGAFGMPSYKVRTWDELSATLPLVQAAAGPVICEIYMHPEQPLVPKLGVAARADGSLVSPPLEDLSPLLPREEVRRRMLIPLHAKSAEIGDV